MDKRIQKQRIRKQLEMTLKMMKKSIRRAEEAIKYNQKNAQLITFVISEITWGLADAFT